MTVATSGVSEWVAFSSDAHTAEGAFEAVIRPKPQKRNSSRSSSSRHKGGTDPPSTTSWMDKPINSDSSWAPVAPPGANVPSSEHPTANKRRPPRTRPSSATMSTRQSSSGSNPVTSSDSSTDGERPSRGRGMERNQSSSHLPRNTSQTRESSRRGRSSSRPRERSASAHARTTVKVDTMSSHSRTCGMPEHVSAHSRSHHGRGRSSSRSRATGGRERSTSITRTRTAATTATGATGRSGSRPPPTSATRRSRSTSRTPATRSRSTSRTRAPAAPVSKKPPPSTSRTRREMRTTVAGSSNSVGPGVPKRPTISTNRSVTSEEGVSNSARTVDDPVGTDISFGRTKPNTPTGSGRTRSQFMEKLFGDQVPDEARQSFMPRSEPSPTGSASESMVSWQQQPDHIHSRILLTATVYHNTATNLWIATINTNQKGVAKNPATASKYLKAFSFSSEKEARESAIANAPPKMMAFEENPSCFICKGKFAMFRRAGHCRNCGVCICNACSSTWPAKMIPDTYNLKKEKTVKVCKSCHYLSGAFKKALADGDYEEALAIYGSGNINLRCPFAQSTKKKEEITYPIHSAVEGGNLEIVRWLMEDHFCPIKVIRTGRTQKIKRGGSADQPILTSQGRSVLTIAMTGLHVDILRYLVVENNVSIYESKDIKGALRALEAVLLALPNRRGERREQAVAHRWDDGICDDESVTSSLGEGTLGEATLDSKSTRKRNSDSCIICYDNAIDCVMTPCGHQVCCLQCSKNLSACPVCNVRGEFIKIFRP